MSVVVETSPATVVCFFYLQGVLTQIFENQNFGLLSVQSGSALFVFLSCDCAKHSANKRKKINLLFCAEFGCRWFGPFDIIFCLD